MLFLMIRRLAKCSATFLVGIIFQNWVIWIDVLSPYRITSNATPPPTLHPHQRNFFKWAPAHFLKMFKLPMFISHHAFLKWATAPPPPPPTLKSTFYIIQCLTYICPFLWIIKREISCLNASQGTERDLQMKNVSSAQCLQLQWKHCEQLGHF